MEISTTTSHATSEAKVTSHYWGYRELTADEVSAVAGGGDFSGDGFDGSSNASSNGNSIGNQASAATEAQACAANNAQLTATLVGQMTQPGGMLLAGAAAYSGWCRNDGTGDSR
jgi:hypothetical protein